MPKDKENQNADQNQQPEDSEAFEFDPVEESFDIQTDPYRKRASLQVEPSGSCRSSVGGTEIVDALAVAAGFTPADGYRVRWGANELRGMVSGYIVGPGDAGATPFRRSKNGKVLYLHMGGVFKKYLKLRPAGTRSCDIKQGVDAKGRPCFMVDIRGGLAVQKGTRNTPPPGAQQAD